MIIQATLSINQPTSYNYFLDYPLSGSGVLSNFVENDMLATGINIGVSKIGNGEITLIFNHIYSSVFSGVSGITTGYYNKPFATGILPTGTNKTKVPIESGYVISGDSQIDISVTGIFSGYEGLTFNLIGIN